MMSWLRRSFAIVLLAGFIPVATSGCFGRFEALRMVYDFNEDIHEDKWVVWVSFLVLSIVPVYGIAVLADVIIFNSVEFWTGQNPVDGSAETLHGPNGEVVTVRYREDGKIDYEIATLDGERHFLTLARSGNSVIALDEEGSLLARVGDLDGKPAFLTQPSY
jgi:hypothetical protein